MKKTSIKIVGGIALLMSLSQCLLDGDYEMFATDYGTQGSNAVSYEVMQATDAALAGTGPSYGVGQTDILETGL